MEINAMGLGGLTPVSVEEIYESGASVPGGDFSRPNN